MRIVHFSIVFLSLFLLTSSFSKIKAQTILVKGKIIDQQSAEPLPFAHIFIQNKTGRVSTSNYEGYFSIQAEIGDTLNFSFIGYRERTYIVKEKSGLITVKLLAVAIQIPSVEIEEESNFLYELLAKSRKTQAYYSKTAKTYLFHQSKLNGQSTEMVESYYNGKYLGYDLNSLKIKNGRIGLQGYKEQYFINMQSSKAVLLHKLMGKNDFFPDSPLGKNKRKLKKLFRLSYQNSYSIPDGHKAYVINFKPRIESNRSFSGRLWLDSNTSEIMQIELRAENTELHPFLPLFPDAKILRVDLNINKRFQSLSDGKYPQDINFQYVVSYLNSKGDTLDVQCNSLLYTFDYSNEFILPYFSFPIELDNDYRKINAFPINQAFWDHKPFTLNDHDGKIEDFFASPYTVRARNVANNALKSDKNEAALKFFEHPYVVWSENRIRMRDMDRENLRPNKPKQKNNDVNVEIQADQFNFEVQLFLDIYPVEDSLSFKTAAIFDPYQSYFYVQHDQNTVVFMNLYFDLAEIYKRILDLRLAKVKDVAKARSIYDEVKAELEKMSKAYFHDVNKGKDLSAMMGYNDLVREALGIDNFRIFMLEQAEEE